MFFPSLTALGAQRIRRDRDGDHDADDHLLNERRDLQKVEAVAQKTNDQDSDRGAADASEAAGKARPADDDRRDRVEFIAEALNSAAQKSSRAD